MKKTLTVILCAVMLALSLAACGSQTKDTDTDAAAASATPLPSPTAGDQLATFMCKVTDKKGTSLKITMYNITYQSWTYAEPGTEDADASPPPTMFTVKPPSSSGESKDINMDVPANVAVTLMNGAAGKLSDIKTGNVVNVTMVGSVVTALSFVSEE